MGHGVPEEKSPGDVAEATQGENAEKMRWRGAVSMEEMGGMAEPMAVCANAR